MSDDIIFRPWGIQNEILDDPRRIIGAFAGKRGGKTEIGAIKSILYQEQKINKIENDLDPFLGIIIAPTYDMLRRLSLKKFKQYASPFIKSELKNPIDINWHDDSIIYGLSADRPERIEGLKASWIWIDEVFQVSEQLFLECRARTADTRGNLLCTGSLGVQFINPKQHWAYKYFIERPDKNTSAYCWTTADNPFFPQDEIETLKEILDPITFRSMFELNWDTIAKNAVYADFNEQNIMHNYVYNPEFETYVSIDWGWAHPMACLFFQYDRKNDVVYLFDEIVSSQLNLENLHKQIMAKPYKINGFCCDIAGNQEREQTGISNIRWFHNKGIVFKFTRSLINYGIPIVRSYMINSKGLKKFFVHSLCKKSIDSIKNYRYDEKDGVILNENPIKKDDDCADSIRYFFVNYLDKMRIINAGSVGSLKGL
jgi:phage terminase large subunit